MKPLIVIISCLTLCISLQINAQSNAIGLRLGGGSALGTEISFQTPFAQNRGEFDLGLGGGSNWQTWKLTGLYQWVMPIENNFYWYLGVGPSLGSWNYVGRHPTEKKEGISLSVALNAGVEYRFSEIPIHASLDIRPEIPIIYRGIYGWLLAIGVRYVF
ncbi:MAG: hypothetical protein LBV41_00725 [Cytophagaceae bacterium]|jgi:outer membrane protein W|nr:hypothetical protein [Cytophagaceae bacterium]